MGVKSEPYIRMKGVSFSYDSPPGSGFRSSRALNNISLDIDRGDYAALIGSNGSGKSTLLRHINALLIPAEGEVWVGPWNTRDEQNVMKIRSSVGMVFQSPDAQIVATVVEEDVAFGPENLGVPQERLQERVEEALEQVGLTALRNRPTHYLSAGQKQLLAIAAALAMHTDCLLLDEASSSLDPASRVRLLDTLQSLHESGITVITATHRMEEAVLANRIVVLDRGSIAMQGDPKQVFSAHEKLVNMGLDIPETMKISRCIASYEPDFTTDYLSVDELVRAVLEYNKKGLQ
jgi:energy-coupling factor transporter ATPase